MGDQLSRVTIEPNIYKQQAAGIMPFGCCAILDQSMVAH